MCIRQCQTVVTRNVEIPWAHPSECRRNVAMSSLRLHLPCRHHVKHVKRVKQHVKQRTTPDTPQDNPPATSSLGWLKPAEICWNLWKTRAKWPGHALKQPPFKPCFSMAHGDLASCKAGKARCFSMVMFDYNTPPSQHFRSPNHPQVCWHWVAHIWRHDSDSDPFFFGTVQDSPWKVGQKDEKLKMRRFLQDESSTGTTKARQIRMTNNVVPPQKVESHSLFSWDSYFLFFGVLPRFVKKKRQFRDFWISAKCIHYAHVNLECWRCISKICHDKLLNSYGNLQSPGPLEVSLLAQLALGHSRWDWSGFHVGRCPSNGQYLSSFIIIYRHLSTYFIIHHHSSSFIIIYQRHLSTFIIIYQHLSRCSRCLTPFPECFSP